MIEQFTARFGASRSTRMPLFLAKDGCFLVPLAENENFSRVLLLPRYAMPLDIEKELANEVDHCSLTDVEYAALVDRLRSVASLGAHIRTIDDPTVTASRSWDIEEYESAYIERAYGNEEHPPQDETFTVRAYVYVPLAVEGTVTKKHSYRIDGVAFWVVTFNERQYWVRERDYSTLQVGSVGRVTAFGPLGIVPDVDFPAAAGTQRSPFGDKLDGFTKSPTEHVINEVDEPFVVRSVTGVIDEPSTEPLPGTLFEIRGPGINKAIRRAQTDDQGRFRIRNVPQGTYRFKVTRPAFQSVIGTLTVSKKAPKSNVVKITMQLGM